jgi:hypothetical protein
VEEDGRDDEDLDAEGDEFAPDDRGHDRDHDDGDDEPAPLTGLGAIGQLLAALIAVAVLGLILVGAAAVVTRLLR